MKNVKFKAYIKDENKIVDVKELSFKYDEVVYEREMNKKELLKQEKTLEKQALNVLLNMAGRRLV